MFILEILFDIISALLSPFISLIGFLLIPVLIIGLITLAIWLIYTWHLTKRINELYGDRYQNPTHPDGYRAIGPDEFFACGTCDFSCRSTREDSKLYCQRHQLDVSKNWICNNYHTAILDP